MSCIICGQSGAYICSISGLSVCLCEADRGALDLCERTVRLPA